MQEKHAYGVLMQQDLRLIMLYMNRAMRDIRSGGGQLAARIMNTWHTTPSQAVPLSGPYTQEVCHKYTIRYQCCALPLGAPLLNRAQKYMAGGVLTSHAGRNKLTCIMGGLIGLVP